MKKGNILKIYYLTKNILLVFFTFVRDEKMVGYVRIFMFYYRKKSYQFYYIMKYFILKGILNSELLSEFGSVLNCFKIEIEKHLKLKYLGP